MRQRTISNTAFAWLFLLGITIVFVLLMLPTVHTYMQYRQYCHSTLGRTGTLPAQATIHVETCIDTIIEWVADCPGSESICLMRGQQLMGQCLNSTTIAEACMAQQTAAQKTSFGYQACQIYAKREYDTERKKSFYKKTCASFYRMFADAIKSKCTS